jgi:protein-L-isoaspartate(D-aspartate) O-methyltransferase
MHPADQANQQLVDRLIAEGALWSRSLIAAFRATPRHRFVDRIFLFQRKQNLWREILTRDPGLEELRLLYADRALITHLHRSAPDDAGRPISSSSQPSLMALMLEDMRVAPGQTVLEIGAGTGYNAALLAHMAGPGQVTTLDVDRNVLSEAWVHLRAFPERAVTLKHTDGRYGLPEAAPFDRIMVTAATADLEPAWLDQLTPEGLLLTPLALAPGLAYVLCGTATEGIFEGQLVRPAYFMPLRAEGEAGDLEEHSEPLAPETKTVAAPWSGWFDRKRPRAGWLGFSQALAVYGLLHGLRVQFQTLPSGESLYGVRGREGACWFGIRKWYVSEKAGCDLGWKLWRAFLDAGAPRPTEFRLRASARHNLPQSSDETYMREGTHCRQQWTLTEPRSRLSAFS